MALTFAADGVDAIRFLISAAIVMKAASTLVASECMQRRLKLEVWPLGSVGRRTLGTCLEERDAQFVSVLLRQAPYRQCPIVFRNPNNLCLTLVFETPKRSGLGCIAPHLSRVVIDGLLCCQITFVAHQQLIYILARAAIDFVQPLFHVVKRVGICHVVHHNDAVRPPVVAARDGTEPLLPSCVPYL